MFGAPLHTQKAVAMCLSSLDAIRGCVVLVSTDFTNLASTIYLQELAEADAARELIHEVHAS